MEASELKQKYTTVNHPNQTILDVKILYKIHPHIDVAVVGMYDLKDRKRYIDRHTVLVAIYYPLGDDAEQENYIKVLITSDSLLRLAGEIKELEGELIKETD